jgi:sugar/nucleoside kinase (ribokinase family)
MTCKSSGAQSGWSYQDEVLASRSPSTSRGLFVGLATLDFVYLATQPPQANQKISALDYTVAAGGPVTNAAVTFSHLGNQATLLAAVGIHPINQFVLSDLKQYGVAIADLTPGRAEPVPTSSIIVTEASGERAVISLNASQSQAAPNCIPAAFGHRSLDDYWQSDDWQQIDVVLIDGHQMAVGQAIAAQAKARQIPVVIDGGSWKPGFEQVLQDATFVIASANFYPPHCQTTTDVLNYLTQLGIPHVAITQGHAPILVRSKGSTHKIAVPSVQTVDTLGAGDVFHGAFCHYILQSNFVEALTQAAEIAALSCQSFGTRKWLDRLSHSSRTAE